MACVLFSSRARQNTHTAPLRLGFADGDRLRKTSPRSALRQQFYMHAMSHPNASFKMLDEFLRNTLGCSKFHIKRPSTGRSCADQIDGGAMNVRGRRRGEQPHR